MKTLPRTLLLATFLLLLLALEGCGFRLRGSVELPPQLSVLHVVDAGHSHQLRRALQQGLDAAGVERVDDLLQATAQLRIDEESYRRRESLIDRRGQIAEYELTYRLQFSLRDGDGESLLDSAEVELSRFLRYDYSQLLAKEREEEELRNHMVQQAVQAMLRLLQADAQWK